MMAWRVWLASALVIAAVRGATWSLSDTVTGDGYFDKFDFFTDKDPTNGLVTYQSEDAARNMNLTYTSGEDFVLRVDTTPVQTEGRPSVRLQSKANYGDSVIVYVD